MSTSIRYLLFDLGGTLMHSRSDWQPIHKQADEALAASLLQSRIELDPKLFRARLSQYYEQRDKDFYETTYHLVLSELLTELNHAEVPEVVIRSALNALYKVTQSNWQIESDAIETFEKLRSEGYKLGIFSNAGDDKDVQELIDSFGIRHYFDFVLTSAASYYRKPHHRAFEIALAHWNALPEESAMIGDSLEADILGANQMDMTSIWITRRAAFTNELLHRIKPDFSIRKLPELFPVLSLLSGSFG
ncbi:MAG: HAD family hydrolase [Anaerolineales bacterium]|nr:HAD family hydrolase [Anaerolineales bacterium]